STEYIIETIHNAEPGTRWLVATELNLVNRLKNQYKHQDKSIHFMSPMVCMCSTMFRTDPQHLAWVLENLVEGHVVNQIKVDKDTAHYATQALEGMLKLG
ncbi:MAG: quinolinate synthase NadA, partial [Gammaproteobacteria bacterium]|nr:quinolinate synthase NadA [Gammaproteobacteria bacterium]